MGVSFIICCRAVGLVGDGFTEFVEQVRDTAWLGRAVTGMHSLGQVLGKDLDRVSCLQGGVSGDPCA
jgi:hypothetical protein